MTAFRDYASAPPQVVALYKTNHEKQTLDYVLQTKERLKDGFGKRLGIWKVLEMLDSLVDESDPDTDSAQTQHALQSAEKARRDEQPRWMVLACLIHDLGKMLCLHGFEQWSVVGDTFPVGIKHSDKIVYSEFFSENPDSRDPKLNSKLGIYSQGCGLAKVHMSYGHDEYLYNVVKDYVPQEMAYVIRFHSFYAWHKEGAYQELLDDTDRRMLPHLLAFNKYDLYSKSEALVDVESVRDYYTELINEFFPAEIVF
ncbi:inositol oxygenase [Chytriomyces cf. hyalinus JEL632]|nr:inositol oxygenase [Chytriomyces cf. hyalinus JEL632]